MVGMERMLGSQELVGDRMHPAQGVMWAGRVFVGNCGDCAALGYPAASESLKSVTHNERSLKFISRLET